MGTKSNPGDYDCYAKADPDEPIFTLRGKDPIAPYLVEIWVATRRGQWKAAIDILNQASRNDAVLNRVSGSSYFKLLEAMRCAEAMRQWRAEIESVPVESTTETHGRSLILPSSGTD